ncbi:MAG: regulatory protein RecX [Bacteroidota bacterium]
MSEKLTYHEAKLKIEHWCAYQERCQYEVNLKLQSYGLFLEERDSLIADLISNRFVDEERFAEAFVSGKFRIKRWGKIKIKQHLKQKFISSYSIQKALNTIEMEDYSNTAISLVEKKNRELEKVKNSFEKKTKIHAYLASKGYEFEVIENAYQDFLQSIV